MKYEEIEQLTYESLELPEPLNNFLSVRNRTDPSVIPTFMEGYKSGLNHNAIALTKRSDIFHLGYHFGMYHQAK